MDKFLHFDSIEFAQETSFINWVNESNVSDINLWNKWIADHPEKRAIVEEAKLLVTAIKFKEEVAPSELENKIWKNIDAATRVKPSVENPGASTSIFRTLKKWAPLAAAAIIALLVYVNVPSGVNYDTTLKTTFAENKQEVLPDESIIDINAESTVAYSKTQWQNNREIRLEGEAYFSVKKGSKFTVVTDNGNVEVLGTSFNVYSRGDVFSVECETGKVSVTTDGKEIILTPNEGVRLDLAINEVSKTSTTSKRSLWRRGTYNYKEVDIREVFDDIERHFDTKINAEAISNKQSYTGTVSNTNIDSVLHKICWPLNLEVTKSGEDYQIRSPEK